MRNDILRGWADGLRLLDRRLARNTAAEAL
jgi:hypothetical protein